MRSYRLARIAAAAELLRLRRLLRRQVMRAAYGSVALVFLFFVLCCAHLAVFLAIARNLGPVSSALIVLGGDLVLAVIFGLLALSSSEDRVEREAREVRERALLQVEEAFATAALVAPLTRRLGGRSILGVALALLLPRLIVAFRR